MDPEFTIGQVDPKPFEVDGPPDANFCFAILLHFCAFIMVYVIILR